MHIPVRYIRLPSILWIPALLLAMAALSHAHEHPGYSHDPWRKTTNRDWMKTIPDSTPIHALSVPGSHETMSLFGGDAVACQSMTLSDQLQSGIRALDIRCRYFNNVFTIHHGSVYQNATFGPGVMDVVRDFLIANPSETVFMRLKNECHGGAFSCSDEGNNPAVTFGQRADQYLAQYASHVWQYSGNNPTLGQVRGRIVILQNYPGGTTPAIPWPAGDRTTGAEVGGIQDWYTLTTNWDLYEKWEYVRNHLDRARSDASSRIFHNFLSASGGSFPYFVASGHSSPGTGATRLSTGWTDFGASDTYPDFPRTSCFFGACTISFEGTNILVTNRLNSLPPGRVGMVYSDFPGPGLINAIIRMNGHEPVVVTNSNDGGIGSLRKAIADGARIIRFVPGLNGATINLTSGDTGGNYLVIDAAGLPGGIRISANSTTRIGTP